MQKETLETQNSLIYHSEYGGDSEIQLEVQQYANNGRIAIFMLTNEEGYPEHYGSLTVNIDAPAPAYCGYLDTNNLSNAEKFVTENGLGEFTGLTGRSGFCVFPLYLFNAEKRGIKYSTSYRCQTGGNHADTEPCCFDAF